MEMIKMIKWKTIKKNKLTRKLVPMNRNHKIFLVRNKLKDPKWRFSLKKVSTFRDKKRKLPTKISEIKVKKYLKKNRI